VLRGRVLWSLTFDVVPYASRLRALRGAQDDNIWLLGRGARHWDDAEHFASLGDGRDDEADATNDQVRWRLVGSESEQLHGVVDLNRAEDESIVFKFGEPELERVADAYGEDGWLRRLIGDRRVVVAIDNGKGLRRQYRLHPGGLLARETHGDEAGPSAARGGAARAHVLEDAERKLHEIEYCRAGRHGVMNGGGRCHNGNRSVGDAACRFARPGMCVIEGEQISEGEHLGGEKTIESAEAEGAAAAKEIGDMRGLESGLAG
jgi:hypothetical protein